jgi:hypothetical protein
MASPRHTSRIRTYKTAMVKVSITSRRQNGRGGRGDTPILSLRSRAEGLLSSGREPLHPDAHIMGPPSQRPASVRKNTSTALKGVKATTLASRRGPITQCQAPSPTDPPPPPDIHTCHRRQCHSVQRFHSLDPQRSNGTADALSSYALIVRGRVLEPFGRSVLPIELQASHTRTPGRRA